MPRVHVRRLVVDVETQQAHAVLLAQLLAGQLALAWPALVLELVRPEALLASPKPLQAHGDTDGRVEVVELQRSSRLRVHQPVWGDIPLHLETLEGAGDDLPPGVRLILHGLAPVPGRITPRRARR